MNIPSRHILSDMVYEGLDFSEEISAPYSQVVMMLSCTYRRARLRPEPLHYALYSSIWRSLLEMSAFVG